MNNVLAQYYGLTDVMLTEAPRGFVAETYIVQSGDTRYFAKIIPVSRYSTHFEASLGVLEQLRKAGVTHINYPIPTLDKRLSVYLEDKILALFNYIDGFWTFDYDFERYVDLVASIHAATAKIEMSIKRETFDLLFTDRLFDHLNRLWSRGFSDPYQSELQTLMLQYRAEILNDFARLENIAAELKRTELEWVITHGDAPGNILKTSEEELYLIDWDDVLLAPRERDTWFHLDDFASGLHRSDSKTFLAHYRKTFPTYTVNTLAYDYYLHLRYFDDLEGFISNILSDDLSEEKRAWNMSQLRKDWLGWLRTLVRWRYS